MTELTGASKEYLNIHEMYHVILGINTAVVSAVLLVLNIITLNGIRRTAELVRYPAYRVMALSIVFDLIQLCVHLISAVFGAYGYAIPSKMNTALGAILSAGWMTSNMFTVLLSFHRALVVAHPLLEEKLFRGLKERVILALFVMIFPIYAALQLTPYSSFIFYYIDLEWNYDFRLPYSHTFFVIDHFSIVALLVCFTLCYADIFHKIFSQNSRNSLERSLTINVFIYGLYYTCIFIYWEFIDEKLEDNPVTNFFSNMMWVVANGLQAILTLILNSAVRKAGTKFMLPSTAGLDKCRQIRLRSLIEAVFKKPSSVVAQTTITVIVSKKAVVAAT